ncbi:MAG: hypothetical protein IT475_16580 [Aquimonas sp.]|nr:hypothetical protein [Aquimonas sp.]
MESPTSTNSRQSRVQPTFRWLVTYGGSDWPQQLVNLADGLGVAPVCGPLVRLYLDPERQVPPTAQRLAWMLRNAAQLTPQDGRLWRALNARVADTKAVGAALDALEVGQTAKVPKSLRLEGPTHADCLIECESAIIWVEGKRFDWLSPSIKWDVTRDQLARNVEAAWSLASGAGKDFCVLICHEGRLKHHEQLLVDGYRAKTWAGGWPHLSPAVRSQFAKRIGTLTWGHIQAVWPEICLDVERA